MKNQRDRVILADLDESSYGGKVYEVINLDYGRIQKPFQVRVKGLNKIAFQHIHDSSWGCLYIGDAGLAPYSGDRWNNKNYTREVKPQLQWIDDWM